MHKTLLDKRTDSMARANRTIVPMICDPNRVVTATNVTVCANIGCNESMPVPNESNQSKSPRSRRLATNKTRFAIRIVHEQPKRQTKTNPNHQLIFILQTKIHASIADRALYDHSFCSFAGFPTLRFRRFRCRSGEQLLRLEVRRWFLLNEGFSKIVDEAADGCQPQGVNGHVR